MTKSFEIKVTDQDRLLFANLSGDFNPLHVDSQYAEQTNFGRPVMHGAFHAGLLSRMAGMHLPGEKCILHDIKIRFHKPLYTPASLLVIGEILSDNGEIGSAKVSVIDKKSGSVYADGDYRFGRHKVSSPALNINPTPNTPKKSTDDFGKRKIIVTGANGGLGNEICRLLGDKAFPVNRGFDKDNSLNIESYSDLLGWNFSAIAGIVHCAWPEPVETGLLESDDLERRLDYEISKPIRDVISLARLLRQAGERGAKIIVIGSSASRRGAHSWRKPAYSLAKTVVPNLVNILATELAPTNHCVIGVEFDVLNGGMNKTMSDREIASAGNRKINGKITEVSEIANHIKWILENDGTLLSGSVIQLENTYKN